MRHRSSRNSSVSKVRFNERKAAISVITIALLLLAGVTSTLGTMYFYMMTADNAPAAEITNLPTEQVLPAGQIEIRGTAAGKKGEIQTILVKIDDGPPVFATPSAADDFSSWSALVEVSPGTHNIVVDVVDAEGKIHSTTQSVTIAKPEPILVLPPEQIVEATGAQGAHVSYPSPEVKGDKISFTDPECSPLSGSLFPIGITEVTCLAIDGTGSALAANFTVSVRDSTPPTIEAPKDVTRKNSDNSIVNGWLGKPKVSDTVDDNVSIFSDAPFYGFPTGTTAVVWTATDDHGNFAQAMQMVTISETIISDEDEAPAGPNQSQTPGFTNGQGSGSSVTYGTGGGGGGGKGGGKGGGGSGSGSTTPSDSTSPSVSITSPASGATVLPGTLVVEGTSSDNVGGSGISSLQVRLDEGQYITATPQSKGNWSTWFISFGSLAAGQHTVYARANDNEDNVQEVSISLTGATPGPSDTTAPSVTASPLGGLYSSPQSVTLTASEPATIYFTGNGNTPTNSSAVYSSPIQITLTTTLKYFARDAAGNSGTVATQVYTIDLTPPTVSASPSGGTFGTSQSVVLTSSEPATIYYTSNGATPTTSGSVYSSPISITATTTLKYFAEDAVGNIGSVATQVYAIDTAAPSVAITQPSANSEITLGNGNILVTGTASDSGSGIKLVEVRVDSVSYTAATPKAAGDWLTWSATVQIPTTGSHSIAARATDNADRTSSDTISLTITTPPPTTLSIAFANIAGGQVLSAKYTVVVSASDTSKVSNIKLYVDNVLVKTESNPPYEFAVDTTGYSNGNHLMKAVATDTTGNTVSASATVNVQNAGLPPPPPSPPPGPAPEGKYLLATMLQYVNTNTLVNIYKPDMVSSDKSRIHVGLNKQVTDSQLSGLLSLPGEHGFEYFSLVEIAENAPLLRAKGIEVIDYDLEPGDGHSPASDLADPVASIRSASQAAHSNDLLFRCSPSKAITTHYGSQLAPYCDQYHIQAQGLQDKPSEYESFVKGIVQKLRDANPKIQISVQLSTQRESATGMTLLETFQNDFSRVADKVDGVSLWYSNDDSALSVCESFTEWFNTNYRS